MTRHLDPIQAAGQKFADVANRCSGHLAVDKHGKPCKPTSRKAARWDAMGALFWAFQVDPADEKDYSKDLMRTLVAAQMIATRRHKCSLEVLCDTLRGDEALDVLRRTYAWAKSNPPDEENAVKGALRRRGA